MRGNGVEYQLLAELHRAKIYVTTTVGHLVLNAYVVDDGQPLTMALLATPQMSSLEPLDRLRSSGLLADFMRMADSVRATAHDESNISPPLSNDVLPS